MSPRTLFYGLLFLLIIVVFIISIYITLTQKDPEKKSLRKFAATCIGLSFGMFIICLYFYTVTSVKTDYLYVENFII